MYVDLFIKIVDKLVDINNDQYSIITQSFGSMGPSSDDCRLLALDIVDLASLLVYAISKIYFFLFKDGADLRMESFSCKQSSYPFSPGENGYAFFDDLPFDVEVDIFVLLFFLVPGVIA